MTVLEILEEHQYEPTSYSVRIASCSCGDWTDAGPTHLAKHFKGHRAHLAEVLDKHVQIRETQAQVNVLNGVASAWEEMASSGATHLYVLMLRETAKRIGADIIGR